MKSTTDIALQTENIAVGYKTAEPILENLSVTLKKGELVCLMGANGVGKSTLLRTISTLQPKLSGAITINEIDVDHLSAKDRAKQLAVVLTDTINAGNMTVEDIVKTGRYPYLGWTVSHSEEDLQILNKSISQMGLEDISQSNINELSDGQLQKVMVARALCQDTAILLLDEPTAHLDLNNRVEIINLLKKLAHTEGKAILMATHELDLALQAADRLWLVSRSEGLISGFPEDLVLSGKIDELFQLKGYDLKTGTLVKATDQDRQVHLTGTGHEYLWTKNALERNGFQLNKEAPITIKIINNQGSLSWDIAQHGLFSTSKLEELIHHLKDKVFH